MDRDPADLAPRPSPTSGRSPRRSPASTDSTASPRCCRRRRPAAGSQRTSRDAAAWPTRWPPPAWSRHRRSRSRPRCRTTSTAPPRRAPAEHPPGEPARRAGAVPAPLAHPWPAADRAPQHLARTHRPGDLRDGCRVPPEPGVEYGTDEVPPLGERPSDATLAALNASIPPQHRFVSALLTGHVAAASARTPRRGRWPDRGAGRGPCDRGSSRSRDRRGPG